MHVLLQLKSYEGYFSLLLNNKKSSEWESAVNNMRENKELELAFKERMKEENEIANVNYVVNKLWDNFMKSCIGIKNSQSESNDINLISMNYPFKLLADILEIFYTDNIFMKDYIEKNKDFSNLIILILVKQVKFQKKHDLNYNYAKLQNFVSKYSEKVNFCYLEELIKNEDLIEEIKNTNLDKFFKHSNVSKNTSNFLETILSESLEKPRIPFQLKVSEMPKYLTFSNNNLIATYTSDDYSCYTIKSNLPILSSIGIYYYEVEIISMCEDIMAIGLIGKDFNVVNKIPGWESISIGYHSDDGNIFVSKTNGDPYGPTFNSGDIVGCCIDFINQVVFFTKNGEALKSVTFLADNELYPSIGMRKINQAIHVNFGDRSFLFDFKQYFNKVLDNIIDEILKVNVIQSSRSKYLSNHISPEYQIVLDYLTYHGYGDTYDELIRYSQSGSTFHHNQKIKERKSIHNCIKQRNFKESLKIIKEHFPNAKFSLCFLTIIEKLQECVNNCNSSVELVKMIRNNIISSEDYIVFKTDFKSDFIVDIMLNKIAQNCCFNAVSKDLLNIYEFSSELIFEKVNENILQSEFSVCSNELEAVAKQLISVLKESLKLKNPLINFLFDNKNFIAKLNAAYTKDSVKYSGILTSKMINNFFIEK